MTKSFTPTNKLHRQWGRRRAKRHARPGLESLEARTVLSGLNPYLQTNLVSDVPGFAQINDLSLVNPWGVSFGCDRAGAKDYPAFLGFFFLEPS